MNHCVFINRSSEQSERLSRVCKQRRNAGRVKEGLWVVQPPPLAHSRTTPVKVLYLHI